MSHPIRKKLIEVSLPLEAINVASAREKSIRHGHPSTLHLWWARRPLAAARAVIFSQMVDDPSSWPDLFPTEKAQVKERQRLFKVIEDLVQWENTTNEEVLQKARDEIWRSWRRACAENVDHPRAKELFDRDKLPAFHDPFAGGGALPLEAQRLGLEAYASDLNPVAVLINKAMIEIPPRFAGKPPVNPDAQANRDLHTWQGAQGLAEDVRYYGQWMRDEAERRIGHLYPKVHVTAEMTAERPDLKPYVGKKLTVTAWLWVRTVKSPNPAFRSVDVPLASTFLLSTKIGREAYVEPLIETGTYQFAVKVGKPPDEAAKSGSKLGRGANFRCILSGVPVEADYIRDQGRRGLIGSRIMAIVAEGERGKIYLSPTADAEEAAKKPEPSWRPEVEFFQQALGFRVGNYGFTMWSHLFSERQLVALETCAQLVSEVQARVQSDSAALNPATDSGVPQRDAEAYADAVSVYLAFAVDRFADYWSTFGRWQNANQQLSNMFGRQAIPMVWDYPEANPFSRKGGSLDNLLDWTIQSIPNIGFWGIGNATQADAATQTLSSDKVVSTDPPYYDNIGYADLSDFFYVWLRRSLRTTVRDLFATVAVPKAEELVATPDRHGGRDSAEKFFLNGMTLAMHRLSAQAHPAFPVTIYYAFKQSETDANSDVASTGWETFLEAVIRAGFATTGTWPMRTEMTQRMRGVAANALASSIILVCRPRQENAPVSTRRDFLTALQRELPKAIADLQRGNIAPVDLQQAAIGPGMAIFTRYAKVLDADGKQLSVRDALSMINQALDEALAHQEADFDSNTRWALVWFEEIGFEEGPFGRADDLARAKNTSVQGIVDAGIAASGRGKVRLLKPEDLSANWNPSEDSRLTVWETVHHLIRALDQGEASAAELLAKLGSQSEIARELAYRLYSISDRTKRSQDALRYNALVQSWPEMVAIAGRIPKLAGQAQLSLEGMQ